VLIVEIEQSTTHCIRRIERNEEMVSPYKIQVHDLKRKQVGMDNIKVDISETGCEDVDRIQLAQNTVY
jgi:hypothetical protein